LKHFPGAGANENGMDSHSFLGRYNVYPGGAFDTHLQVMRDAIDGSNPFAIMPMYSIIEDVTFKGTLLEPVGASFVQDVMVDYLRGDLGWDGMVTSDWGAIGSCQAIGTCSSGSAWGTEKWTNGERIKAYLDAGGHQIGNGRNVMWEDALKSGDVTEAEIADTAAKVLELTFTVGAFENPYVDAAAAPGIISQYEDEAHEAMMRAFTLLKNTDDILPLDASSVDQNGTKNIQVYYDGHDDKAVQSYVDSVAGFERVTDLASADYAVVRFSARYGIYPGLDGGVPLSFRDPILTYDQGTDAPSSKVSTFGSWGGTAEGNNVAASQIADTLDAAVAAKATNPDLKIIVVGSMYRPFIVEPWLADIDVFAAEFGMTDAALLDMVFQMRNGKPDATVQPTGTLPMEIPSSQDEVYASDEDVPHDTANPSFEIGAGILSY